MKRSAVHFDDECESNKVSRSLYTPNFKSSLGQNKPNSALNSKLIFTPDAKDDTVKYQHKATPFPKNVLTNKLSNGKSEAENKIEYEKRSSEYFMKLGSLNRTFSRWIERYLETGLHYDFTPVCNDYIKFITGLREKYPQDENEEMVCAENLNETESTSHPNPINKANTGPNPGEKGYTSTPFPKLANEEEKRNTLKNQTEDITSNNFSSKSLINNTSEPPTRTINANLFETKFKAVSESKTETNSKPTFSTSLNGSVISSAQNSITSSAPTVITSVTSFPPISIAVPNVSNKVNTITNEDEEYQPPKPESVEINEDSVYSVKCKLFYKKDQNYIEKGKGTLYIKKQENDSNKSQLLIRADNTLGTILLNIHLTKKIPTYATKSGVLMTCIPNPPINPKDAEKKDAETKSVAFFIRVKDDSVKEILLDNLEKHKSD